MEPTTTAARNTISQRRPMYATGDKRNRVYIEDGEVKWDFATDTVSIDEAQTLLHQVIELEYSLP